MSEYSCRHQKGEIVGGRLPAFLTSIFAHPSDNCFFFKKWCFDSRRLHFAIWKNRYVWSEHTSFCETYRKGVQTLRSSWCPRFWGGFGDIWGGSGRVFGNPEMILGSPRCPQGFTMKLGEYFAKLWEGLGRLWELLGRRPTAQPIIYTNSRSTAPAAPY